MRKVRQTESAKGENENINVVLQSLPWEDPGDEFQPSSSQLARAIYEAEEVVDDALLLPENIFDAAS